jgi:hypothetical protein
LPGLRLGQEWTVPMYSPIAPYQAPMEILTATVEGTERISWMGESVDAWMVVYRSQGNSGLGGSDSPHSQLWVRQDGTVLRQDTNLFGATMSFVRLSESAARRLYDRVENKERGQYRWQPLLPSILESLRGAGDDPPTTQDPVPGDREPPPASGPM